MSEKGPFDAAISLFQEAVKQTRLGDFDTDHFIAQKHGLYRLGLISQAELAIHFLEAAGKVDKVHCLDKLDFLRRMAGEDKFGFVRYSEDGLAIFPTAQIRALLESLPDGGEK